MALTLSNRREGVTATGRRSVTYTCVFSDGATADITKAVLGLTTVEEARVVVAASGGTGVDLTVNDATKITLDPVAAATVDMVFIGYER